MIEDRGEIEFFDFVPVHFVNELESDIQSLIKLNFKNNKLLLESCKKNMFIFKNFVLRNILRFPSKFTYERKKTDLVVDSSFSYTLHALYAKRDKLKSEVASLRRNISILKNKEESLNTLLQFEGDINQASSNIKNIKDKFNNIMEYLSTLPFLEIDEDNFHYLLEYREIRSEVLKREWEELSKRIEL